MGRWKHAPGDTRAIEQVTTHIEDIVDDPPQSPDAALWSRRLYDRIGLPPIWIGISLAALSFMAVLGVESATGRLEGFLARDDSARIGRGLAVQLILLGYLPTAQLYLAGWTRLHVDMLRPLLAGGQRLVFRDVYREPSSRLAGIAGGVSFLVLFLLVPLYPLYRNSEYWTPESTFFWLGVPFTGWLVARLAHALLFDALFVSRLAADLREIDLIDRRALTPFVQQGLRSSLLFLLFIGIGLAGLVGQRTLMATATLSLIGVLGIAFAALALPVTGVRERIRNEKQRQLAALRSRINQDREAVLSASATADAATRRLPGLLALEARLETVHEWPFDVPSLLRFGLYILLGFGSWLGAAGVERMLDAALR